MILKYLFLNSNYLQTLSSSNGQRILKKSKSPQKYFGFRIGSVLFVHHVSTMYCYSSPTWNKNLKQIQSAYYVIDRQFQSMFYGALGFCVRAYALARSLTFSWLSSILAPATCSPCGRWLLCSVFSKKFSFKSDSLLTWCFLLSKNRVNQGIFTSFPFRK